MAAEGMATNNSSDCSVPADIAFQSLIMDICFHPTKDVIAAGSIDGNIYLWSSSSDGSNNHEIMTFNHHKRACRAIEFSANGEKLFSVSKDKTLQVVDLNSGAVEQKISKAHLCPIYSLKVVDEYLVATGDDDGTVKVWDFRRANAIMELKATEEYISSLMIGDDKRILVATSGDGTLSAYHVRARRLELQSEGLDDELLCSAILKEGSKVVAGSGNGALNIFNWGEWGNISDRFPGHPSSVDCMIPITDSIVCTGSFDGAVRAINILPNRFIGIVGQHGDFPIEDISLSRDGKVLASCSHDQTIKFWHIGYLHNIAVEDKHKAKKNHKKKHLPMFSNKDFFSDLAM